MFSRSLFLISMTFCCFQLFGMDQDQQMQLCGNGIMLSHDNTKQIVEYLDFHSLYNLKQVDKSWDSWIIDAGKAIAPDGVWYDYFKNNEKLCTSAFYHFAQKSEYDLDDQVRCASKNMFHQIYEYTSVQRDGIIRGYIGDLRYECADTDLRLKLPELISAEDRLAFFLGKPLSFQLKFEHCRRAFNEIIQKRMPAHAVVKDLPKLLEDFKAICVGGFASARVPNILAGCFCRDKNSDLLKIILDSGVTPNGSFGRCYFLGTSGTLLTIACRNRDQKTIKLLLDYKVNIHQLDELGKRPLLLVFKGDDAEMAELFLNKIVEFDIENINLIYEDYNKSTLLTLACEYGCQKIVELLLNRGADINYLDGNGKSPLFVANQKKHLMVMQLLLERGAKSIADSTKHDFTIAGWKEITDGLNDLLKLSEERSGVPLLPTASSIQGAFVCGKGLPKQQGSLPVGTDPKKVISVKDLLANSTQPTPVFYKSSTKKYPSSQPEIVILSKPEASAFWAVLNKGIVSCLHIIKYPAMAAMVGLIVKKLFDQGYFFDFKNSLIAS